MMMIDKKSLWHRYKSIFILIFVLLVGVTLSYYVVEYPQDGTVARLVTYDKIMQAMGKHLSMVCISSGLALLTAFPLGILLTRRICRKIAPRVVAIINIAQTIPSLAIIALFVGVLGIGAPTAILALWLYSLLPILNNTMVGIMEVDKDIIEAARGMGMQPRRILWKVELPLAMPIILAGIRTSVTITIGTAILGAFVGAGGLGDFIISGNNVSRWQVLILGATLPALMALFTDYLFGLLEEKVAI